MASLWDEYSRYGIIIDQFQQSNQGVQELLEGMTQQDLSSFVYPNNLEYPAFRLPQQAILAYGSWISLAILAITLQLPIKINQKKKQT